MNNFESPMPPQSEQKPVVKKVAELSLEYQDDREGEKAYTTTIEKTNYFGGFTLGQIQNLRSRSKPIDEQLSIFPDVMREQQRDSIARRFISSAEADKQIQRELRTNLAYFRKLLTHGKTGQAAEAVLLEAIANPKISGKIKSEGEMLRLSKRSMNKYATPPYPPVSVRDILVERIFGKTSYDNQELVFLNALVGSSKISGELWTLVLENHREQFEQSTKNFTETLEPELARTFHQRMQRAIEQVELPMDSALLERRLAETTVLLRDAIEVAFDDVNGSYYPGRSVVWIDPRLTQPKRREALKEVYFHEMLHVLSGRSIVAKTSTFEDKYRVTTFQHQRIGTHFYISQTGVDRFRWLSEALTERLALRYIGQTGRREAHSYYKEEQLLEFLSMKGKVSIDEHLFLEAFFENLDPTLPPERRLPGWKALSEKIAAAWGTGFLNRLDQQVRTHGPAKALEWLQGQKHS